ncbi:MAG: DUF885 domain-containing protein [Candidatus Heimdallarchaeota archaeon]|nr:DUF885 domain-containing protein [Candidatus Heimdallarchaeota archaeon]
MEPKDKFTQLIVDEWEYRVKDNPIFATLVGIKQYNDKLPIVGEEAVQTRIRKYSEFLESLHQINKYSLDQLDQLNYDLFLEYISLRLEQLQFRDYRMPISKMSGFHTFLPTLHLHTTFNDEEDYEMYITRISNLDSFIEGSIELMKQGLIEGQIPPKVTLEGVRDSIQFHIVQDPTKSSYYTPFNDMTSKIDTTTQERLKDKAKKIIQEVVVPAHEKLISFLDTEYLSKLREDIAATNLPQGEAYYKHCIKHYTTMDYTAQQIHDIGMNEVLRIRGEMEEILNKVSFEGTIKEFIHYLRTDEKFYPKSAEELMQKTALVLKIMDGKLPSLFKTLPRLPYGIREIPEFEAPGSTTAYYTRGTGDGKIAGYYWVNTYDLPSRPLYEIEALSLHEAVPGHHLQLALQQELDLPNFRKFGSFTAFVEGWGLYSERLGLEAGFYKDHYSDFGRLSYEMWRATRLVVDTGMHALGWSRQKAIDFMLEYTSLTELNIINEIDRYIAWPGQALAYKLGELKIRELRERAEKHLGNKFDIREFHHKILENGSIPLNILDNIIDKWIKE